MSSDSLLFRVSAWSAPFDAIQTACSWRMILQTTPCIDCLGKIYMRPQEVNGKLEVGFEAPPRCKKLKLAKAYTLEIW